MDDTPTNVSPMSQSTCAFIVSANGGYDVQPDIGPDSTKKLAPNAKNAGHMNQ